MKKTIIILSLISLCYVCKSCLQPSIVLTKQMKEAYAQVKEYYPHEIISFFPDLNSGKLMALELSSVEFSQFMPRCLHVLKKIRSKELEDIRSLTDSAVAVYSFKDSDLLLIDYKKEKVAHFPNLQNAQDTTKTYSHFWISSGCPV